MNWYIQAWRKYAVFDGRARRSEYWLFNLFNFLILCILLLIDFSAGRFDPEMGWGVLSGLYTLLVCLPSLSVSVRRLHDSSKSGWWLLIGIIPILGSLILLVFMLQDSSPGRNQYGPNPKEASRTTYGYD